MTNGWNSSADIRKIRCPIGEAPIVHLNDCTLDMTMVDRRGTDEPPIRVHFLLLSQGKKKARAHLDGGRASWDVIGLELGTEGQGIIVTTFAGPKPRTRIVP